jgi:hypothetical protein
MCFEFKALKFVSIQKDKGERVMELPLQCVTRLVCKLKSVTIC